MGETIPGDADYPARSYYRGREARRYHARRTTTRGQRRKWAAEEAALGRVLARLPVGSTLLDLPCGTGRFLPLAREHGLLWHGGDISLDMLQQAKTKAGDSDPPPVLICDAEHLPFATGSFDYTVSVRFFNLLPEDRLQRVLAEFARVSHRGVLAQIRLAGRFWPIDPLLRWLRGTALPGLARLARGGSPRAPAKGCSRMFPLPSLYRFSTMAEKTGLEVAAVHQVGGWRGLTHGDRLKLCVLRAADARCDEHPDR